jgi:hypothetical protein
VNNKKQAGASSQFRRHAAFAARQTAHLWPPDRKSAAVIPRLDAFPIAIYKTFMNQGLTGSRPRMLASVHGIGSARGKDGWTPAANDKK